MGSSVIKAYQIALKSFINNACACADYTYGITGSLYSLALSTALCCTAEIAAV
jgi:hypothetical protein